MPRLGARALLQRRAAPSAGRPRDLKASGPISRVLSSDDHLSRACVTARLKHATRMHGRAAVWHSYLRLLRMGFSKPRRCRRAGALLPHRFSFSPAVSDRGVFFSVALSVRSPRPAVSWHPALGSPDFPHVERAIAWPACGGIVARRNPRARQNGASYGSLTAMRSWPRHSSVIFSKKAPCVPSSMSRVNATSSVNAVSATFAPLSSAQRSVRS